MLILKLHLGGFNVVLELLACVLKLGVDSLKVTLELVMHLVLELLACVLKLLLVRLHLVLQLLADFLQLGLYRLEVSVHLAQEPRPCSLSLSVHPSLKYIYFKILKNWNLSPLRHFFDDDLFYY